MLAGLTPVQGVIAAAALALPPLLEPRMRHAGHARPAGGLDGVIEPLQRETVKVHEVPGHVHPDDEAPIRAPDR